MRPLTSLSIPTTAIIALISLLIPTIFSLPTAQQLLPYKIVQTDATRPAPAIRLYLENIVDPNNVRESSVYRPRQAWNVLATPAQMEMLTSIPQMVSFEHLARNRPPLSPVQRCYLPRWRERSVLMTTVCIHHPPGRIQYEYPDEVHIR